MPFLRSTYALQSATTLFKPFLVLSAAIGLSLALSGCGQNSTSDVSENPTPQTASAAPETTTVVPETPAELPAMEPPTLPEAAKENTEEGAIAFTEYFVEVLNYTFSSLDLGPLFAISDESCKVCNDYFAQIADLKDLNAEVKDFKMVVKRNQIEMIAYKSDVAGIEFQAISHAYRVSSPTSTDEYQARTLDRAIVLAWDEGWKIHAFGTPEQ